MQKKIFGGVAFVAMLVTLVVTILVRGGHAADGVDYASMLHDGLLRESVKEDGVDYAVPPERLYEAGLKAEEYPALTNPKMTSVATMDAVLGDESLGIAVATSNGDEFYPFQILNWHYVVNRQSEGSQLAIVHDPLTGNSVVYETASPLVPTGLLYDNAMLLRDDSGTMWWPTRGVSVAGKLGQTLRIVASDVMTWGDWKDAYPNGTVLSNDTGVVRDYTRHPYGGYDKAFTIYYGVQHHDARLDGPKWIVQGLSLNGEAMAFAPTLLAKTGVANETVGEQAVVGIYDEDRAIVRVFAAAQEDERVTLAYSAETGRIIDTETGSTWSATGAATAGARLGAQLEELTTQPMFWFAWASAYPETKIAAEAALHEESTTPNATE